MGKIGRNKWKIISRCYIAGLVIILFVSFAIFIFVKICNGSVVPWYNVIIPIFFIADIVVVALSFKEIQNILEGSKDELQINHENPQPKSVNNFEESTFIGKEHTIYSTLFFKRTLYLLVLSFLEVTVCFIEDILIKIFYNIDGSLMSLCISMTLPLITIFIVSSCFLVARNDKQLDELQRRNFYLRIKYRIYQSLKRDFEDLNEAVYLGVDNKSFLVLKKFIFPLSAAIKGFEDCQEIYLSEVQLRETTETFQFHVEQGTSNSDYVVPVYLYTCDNNRFKGISNSIKFATLIYKFKLLGDNTERSLSFNANIRRQSDHV